MAERAPPPARQEPRRLGSWRLIAATPLAIVASRAKHLIALDPEPGETLWTRSGLLMTFVAGGALVRGRWHHVSWFDLRSGEQLREEPVRGAYRALAEAARLGVRRLVRS